MGHLTDEQEEFILKLYEITKKLFGKASQTEAQPIYIDKHKSYITPKTIRIRWDEAGFEKQKRGGQRHGLGKNFRGFYNGHGKDISSIVQELDCPKESIVRLCKKYCEDPKNIHSRVKLGTNVERKYSEHPYGIVVWKGNKKIT